MKQPDIIIREVKAEELPELRTLSLQTFIETFAKDNSVENMQAYLDEAFAPGKLEKEFRHPETAFYFALSGDLPVGYLKLQWGKAQSERMKGQSLEIERIYVLMSQYGKQAGPTLLEKAIAVAAEKGSEYIWLGVWEANARAIRFYEKNGFEVFSKHNFRLGQETQTDLLMKRMLK